MKLILKMTVTALYANKWVSKIKLLARTSDFIFMFFIQSFTQPFTKYLLDASPMSGFYVLWTS